MRFLDFDLYFCRNLCHLLLLLGLPHHLKSLPSWDSINFLHFDWLTFLSTICFFSRCWLFFSMCPLLSWPLSIFSFIFDIIFSIMDNSFLYLSFGRHVNIRAKIIFYYTNISQPCPSSKMLGYRPIMWLTVSLCSKAYLYPSPMPSWNIRAFLHKLTNIAMLCSHPQRKCLMLSINRLQKSLQRWRDSSNEGHSHSNYRLRPQKWRA